MTLTEKSGHLAWCALVALALVSAGCWRSLAGTRKPLSNPIAGDRAEATPIFARYRMASEAGASAQSWPAS